MIEIDDKLISEEIFTQKFVCDLNACKGGCCVAGDAGAPLEVSEIAEIKDNLDGIKKYMRPIGIKTIEQTDIYYNDRDETPVTTLVNGEECAFVYFDDQNMAKCAIEKAYLEGDSTFLKPVSCHLYPIRVKKMKYYNALNYDEWDICKPACACGEELNVSVFRFLKEPIIRAFGKDFFDKLVIVDREYMKNKK